MYILVLPRLLQRVKIPFLTTLQQIKLCGMPCYTICLSPVLTLSLCLPTLLVPTSVFWIESTPKAAWKSTLIGIYYIVDWQHEVLPHDRTYIALTLFQLQRAHSAHFKYANHMLQAANAITYCVINLFPLSSPGREVTLAALSFAFGRSATPQKATATATAIKESSQRGVYASPIGNR